MKNIHKITMLFIAASLVLVSCKKDSKTSIPEDYQPKFSETNTIKVSSALQNNTDPEAQQAYNSAVQLKTYIEGYSSLFNIPEDAEYVSAKTAASNASGTWTWTYGYYQVYLTFNETATKYEFEYDYQYQGSTYYLITGWENLAQTQGHYEVDQLNVVNLEMDWEEATTGNFYITMDYSAYGTFNYFYDAHYNADGSGDYSAIEDNMPFHFYLANWNAAGSGTATYYDGSDGTIQSSYTF